MFCGAAGSAPEMLCGEAGSAPEMLSVVRVPEAGSAPEMLSVDRMLEAGRAPEMLSVVRVADAGSAPEMFWVLRTAGITDVGPAQPAAASAMAQSATVETIFFTTDLRMAAAPAADSSALRIGRRDGHHSVQVDESRCNRRSDGR